MAKSDIVALQAATLVVVPGIFSVQEAAIVVVHGVGFSHAPQQMRWCYDKVPAPCFTFLRSFCSRPLPQHLENVW